MATELKENVCPNCRTEWQRITGPCRECKTMLFNGGDGFLDYEKQTGKTYWFWFDHTERRWITRDRMLEMSKELAKRTVVQ
jgi:hypothetical protein